MATNTLVPATWVSRKSLSILHAKASAAARVDRNYEKDFQPIGGVPRGTTITVRLPFKYLTASGNVLAAQNSVQRTAALTVNQLNVGVNFSSVERAQDLGDFAEQVLEPAMSQLGGQIEGNLLGAAVINGIPKVVGTQTTTVVYQNILQARQYLTQALAPSGDSRTLLVDPAHNVDFVTDNKALYNPQVSISDQWVEGLIAEKTAGFMAIENTKLVGYTTGTYGTSTPTLGAATTYGNAGTGNAYASTMTVSTSAWASGGTTLNAGDVFTISNVYDVDPETKTSLGRLKQFTVQTQVSDAGGVISALVLAPCAIYGGAYQNVSAQPASGAAILTFASAAISGVGGGGQTFRQSIAIARDAILFASVPMENLSNVSPYYAQETFDGFTLRVASIYDVNNDFIPLRLDVLVGQTLAYPEVAVRVWGT